MKNKFVREVVSCYHCGNECDDTSLSIGSKVFCCHGCITVFGILHQHDLDNYYCLNNSPGNKIQNVDDSRWLILNEPEIQSKYILYKDQKIAKASFYLPQMHCSSCVWLLEHLSKINSAILKSEVNFNSKKVYIHFDPAKIKLSEVAAVLSSVGYEPYLEKQANHEAKVYSNSGLLIGIVGFCFVNIMILSFPEYVGLSMPDDKLLTNVFRYISLLLAIPVFYISLITFFKSAYIGLKNKLVNIDLPIALAILVTSCRSVYDIYSGYGSGFLDSMSGIVFFMLLGRYVQDKTNVSLNFNRNYTSYFPLSVRVKWDTTIHRVPVSDIKPNDILSISFGEVVPVDSILISKSTNIDYSFLSGESEYQQIKTGDIIYAGGRLVDQNAEMISIKSFSQSDFIQLWNQSIFSKTNVTRAWTDRLAQYFTYVILSFSLGSFMYWYFKGDIPLGLHALTSTLIVACPCTLLLSATFAHGFVITRLSQKGIYLKSAQVFESLLAIKHIVFDKTGTITPKTADRIKLDFSTWNKREKLIALSLLSNTNHPLAKSIIDHEGFSNHILDIVHFKEIPGKGIEGWVDEQHFKIGSAEFTNQNSDEEIGSKLFVLCNNNLIAVYSLSFELKSGVDKLFKNLVNYKLTILSGDRFQNMFKIKNILQHIPVAFMFEKKPIDKLKYIEYIQSSGDAVMMVGDGLNDAGALKQSNVGVALAADHFNFTPACDIIMEDKNIAHLDSILRVATAVRWLILCTFAYSILYNFIGIGIAVQGKMLPVIAAILMPLSSIGVICFDYLGSKIIAEKYLNF